MAPLKKKKKKYSGIILFFLAPPAILPFPTAPEGMSFVTLMPALGPYGASFPSQPDGKGDARGAIPESMACQGVPAQGPDTPLAGGPRHSRAVPESAQLPPSCRLPGKDCENSLSLAPSAHTPFVLRRL